MCEILDCMNIIHVSYWMVFMQSKYHTGSGIKGAPYPDCNKTMLSAYIFREETIKWQCKLFIFHLVKLIWVLLLPRIQL